MASAALAQPIEGWRALVRSLLGIRRIQGYFAYIGQYLQLCPETAYEVFPNIFPNESISAEARGSSRDCRSHVSADPAAPRAGEAHIAQDTREGLEKLASGLKESVRRPGTVDVRGIGKPDAAKGSHDEVQKVRKSWSYKFETWFCSQWPSGQEALDLVRGISDDPVKAVDLLNSTITDLEASAWH